MIIHSTIPYTTCLRFQSRLFPRYHPSSSFSPLSWHTFACIYRLPDLLSLFWAYARKVNDALLNDLLFSPFYFVPVRPCGKLPTYNLFSSSAPFTANNILQWKRRKDGMKLAHFLFLPLPLLPLLFLPNCFHFSPSLGLPMEKAHFPFSLLSDTTALYYNSLRASLLPAAVKLPFHPAYFLTWKQQMTPRG